MMKQGDHHHRSPRALSIIRPALLGGVALVVACFALQVVPSSAIETARALPPPAIDEQAGQEIPQVAVLAGGCFWGVQGVFQHVDGVIQAVAGYAGGKETTAHYGLVSTSTTGHAEAVQVTFDPRKISYGRILQIYFSVAHDPTELNRQGPDTGTQYRSAIFPVDADQARIAQAYISQLGRSQAFEAAIVTRIEPGHSFYPAEGYHQDYLAHHPNNPYIAINDMPKLGELKRLMPESYRAEPVLVGAVASN